MLAQETRTNNKEWKNNFTDKRGPLLLRSSWYESWVNLDIDPRAILFNVAKAKLGDDEFKEIIVPKHL